MSGCRRFGDVRGRRVHAGGCPVGGCATSSALRGVVLEQGARSRAARGPRARRSPPRPGSRAVRTASSAIAAWVARGDLGRGRTHPGRAHIAVRPSARTHRDGGPAAAVATSGARISSSAIAARARLGGGDRPSRRRDLVDLCVDVWGASTADGAGLKTYSCNKGRNQKWHVPIGAADGAAHRLQSVVPGAKCADVTDGSMADRGQVTQYACHEGNNQAWRLRAPAAGSSFPIENENSHKCLDVIGGLRGDVRPGSIESRDKLKAELSELAHIIKWVSPMAGRASVPPDEQAGAACPHRRTWSDSCLSNSHENTGCHSCVGRRLAPRASSLTAGRGLVDLGRRAARACHSGPRSGRADDADCAGRAAGLPLGRW